MESPIVVEKPPEYRQTNERGFPFDEDESGAWSELAARHPDIAARLRQRPSAAAWQAARKRRPAAHGDDDFGESFGSFDRFPFDDIPAEFREHLPSHWNRRFSARDDQHPPQQHAQASPPQQPSSSPPQQQQAATQTEPSTAHTEHSLPQYGLRNTVDLGQKSPADPSLVDADDRNHRSMSAPPDGRANSPRMSANHEQPRPEGQPSNVRVIPIVVEGRDEPVINKSVDHGTHFGETKPTYAPPPPPPHVDREQFFDDAPMGYGAPPPNFGRAFGAPYSKFRQGPQPFTHQKVYPQSASAFGRAGSPQRSQSPKPQAHPHPHPSEEHYVKVPVHHEQPSPRAEQPPRPQAKSPLQPQQRAKSPQPPPQQQQQQQRTETPPPQPKPQQSPADPITQILAIQTDVLNLMTDVENFKGTKKDKQYMYLDEMLTRNLIKLDNIETDGKENIRQARREAIKCIQKCIAVLEAKADNRSLSTPQPQEVEMKENTEESASQPQEVEMKETSEQKPTENGEVEMAEPPKEEAAKVDQPPQEEKTQEQAAQPAESKEAAPQAADTRPENAAPENAEAKSNDTDAKPEQKEDKTKPSPKKGTKNVKKRDKSKDNKDVPNKDVPKDSNKSENVDKTVKDENKKELEDKKQEAMQVDDKGDNKPAQVMEVDASQ